MLHAVYYSSCILFISLFVESFTADFKLFGSYKYHFGLNEVQSFNEANKSCEALNASLVVMKNEAIRNFLVTEIVNLNLTEVPYSFYIGLKQIGSNSDFQWIDGSLLLEEDKYWKDGEPNNQGGNENCVIMGWKYSNEHPYKWYDQECNIRSRYICQRDINECDYTEACHRDANCINTEGSFNCICNDGYSGDGKSCADINECDNSEACHRDASCTNTEGSFKCKCNDGYTGDGNFCGDINECDNTETCHRDANCNNTEGSFNCKCNDGYNGDGKSCADIVECDNTETCHRDASCSNTEGSFNCKCNDGYTGDGNTCADINECDDTEACDRDANCTNTEGSFNCTCNDGNTGDGNSCAATNASDLAWNGLIAIIIGSFLVLLILVVIALIYRRKHLKAKREEILADVPMQIEQPVYCNAIVNKPVQVEPEYVEANRVIVSSKGIGVVINEATPGLPANSIYIASGADDNSSAKEDNGAILNAQGRHDNQAAGILPGTSTVEQVTKTTTAAYLQPIVPEGRQYENVEGIAEVVYNDSKPAAGRQYENIEGISEVVYNDSKPAAEGEYELMETTVPGSQDKSSVFKKEKLSNDYVEWG